METKPLSLMQRLEADSPVFFKKAELLGLALIALAATLTQVPGIPPTYLAILATVGATMKVISMFAVKDVSAITNPNASLQDYLNLAEDLKNQFSEVKQTISNTLAQAQPPAKPAEEVPALKVIPATTSNIQDAVQQIEDKVVDPPIQVSKVPGSEGMPIIASEPTQQIP